MQQFQVLDHQLHLKNLILDVIIRHDQRKKAKNVGEICQILSKCWRNLSDFIEICRMRSNTVEICQMLSICRILSNPDLKFKRCISLYVIYLEIEQGYARSIRKNEQTRGDVKAGSS